MSAIIGFQLSDSRPSVSYERDPPPPSCRAFAAIRPTSIMDSDQRAGLRGYSAVGRRDCLVAIAERRWNGHVELKFPRRNQASELHGCGDTTDLDYRQRRQRAGLADGPALHGYVGRSKSVGIKYDGFASLGGSARARIDHGRRDQTPIQVRCGYIWPAVENEKRRRQRLRRSGECGAGYSVVSHFPLGGNGESIGRSQDVHLQRADVVYKGRLAIYSGADGIQFRGHGVADEVRSLPDACIAWLREIRSLDLDPCVRRNSGAGAFRVGNKSDGR